MEALFSTQLASYEAWLILLCIFVFIGIYVFDGITFVRKVITAFTPQPPVLPIASAVNDTGVEVVSPMLEEITPAEIQAHEEEKETQILAEEVEMKKLDEDEAKLIEEASIIPAEVEIQPIEDTIVAEAPEELAPEIGEVYPETTDILEETNPEPEDIPEALESIDIPVTTEEATLEVPVIARDEAIQPLPDTIVPEASVIPAEAGIQSEEENATPEMLKSIPEPIIEPSIEKPEVVPVRREKEGNVEKLYLITNEVKTLIAR